MVKIKNHHGCNVKTNAKTIFPNKVNGTPVTNAKRAIGFQNIGG